MRCGQGVVVWVDNFTLAVFSLWFISEGVGSGLVRRRGMGESIRSFAGGCRCGYGCGVFVTCGGDWSRACVAACVGCSGRPLGLAGKVMDEVGYICV